MDDDEEIERLLRGLELPDVAPDCDGWEDASDLPDTFEE